MLKRFLILFFVTGLLSGFGFCFSQDNPESVLLQYYANINEKDFKGAYSLRSESFRHDNSFQSWSGGWKNNISTGYYYMNVKTNTGNKAIIEFGLGSQDRISDKETRYGNYKAQAKLIKENGKWRIEDIQVTPQEEYTAEAIEPKQEKKKPSPFPEDIPIYPGFEMKPPRAFLDPYSGNTVNVVECKQRVSGINPDDVAKYYEEKLIPRGWTTQGPAGGSSALAIMFKKDNRVVSVGCYQTTWQGTDAPVDPRGTVLVITYYKE
ncbi:MAG: hypothetical protein ACLFQV_06355 [Vulcanimicrobiota bacterium]